MTIAVILPSANTPMDPFQISKGISITFFILLEPNPGSCVVSNHCAFFSLPQSGTFPHSFLMFHITDIFFLRLQADCSVICPSLWVCLMFSHYQISAMHFWQEFCGSDAVFSQLTMNDLMCICLVTDNVTCYHLIMMVLAKFVHSS